MAKKLIVGLGNIGAEYDLTRHNIGFRIVDQLAEQLNGSWKIFDRLAAVAKVSYKEHVLLLAKPLTYMNLSGKAVLAIKQFEKIDLENICIICDDVELGIGTIRIRPKGSSGGHNGLKSIAQELSTQDFARLRVGVGRSKQNLTAHVLGRFSAGEEKALPNVISGSIEASLDWVSLDIDRVMAKHNRKNDQTNITQQED